MQDVIVFGRGWYFTKKREELEKRFKIIAFLDNAANLNTVNDNIPTYLPEEVSKLPAIKIVIMSIVHFIDMYHQLIMEGVSEERIDFGMNYIPYYDSAEETLNSLKGRVLSQKNRLTILCDNGSYVFDNIKEYKEIMDRLIRENLSLESVQKLPLIPYSRRFGEERGTPVDRYYIDNFIESNKNKVRGNVMEIGDDSYTKRFGSNVDNSYVLHALGLGDNAIKGDLVSGEGLNTEFLDCFICTQTIQMIYDVDRAVKNMYCSLKPGGSALVTLHGISQLSMADYDRWGEYWRFTKKSAEILFNKYFDEVLVSSYGNVKTVTAHLYGLCKEDLSGEDYNYNDEQYQLIITVLATKHL